MKNLTMKTKLFIVLGILTVVSVTVATIGISKLRAMNDRLNRIANTAAEKVKLAAYLDQDLLVIGRAEKNLILSTDPTDMAQYAQVIDQTLEQLKQHADQLRALLNDAEKVKLDRFLQR